MQQWTLEGSGSFDALKHNDKAEVPQLGDKDVLVKRKPLLPQISSTILTSQQSTPPP
jgi:hypothetical protein